jgi:hypothetical protein
MFENKLLWRITGTKGARIKKYFEENYRSIMRSFVACIPHDIAAMKSRRTQAGHEAAWGR